MTRFSKKCVWIIVLGVLLLGVVIFLGWGSKGFRYWDTSEWFNRWGKGKPAVVRVVEPPAEQQAMALMSADDDETPEFILDSADGVTAVETEKLPTPILSYSLDKKELTIEVPGNVLGSVVLGIYPTDSRAGTTYYTVGTYNSSKFTSTGSSYVCKIGSVILNNSLAAVRANSKYLCVDFNSPLFAFKAIHFKNGYIDSDISDPLNLMFFANPEVKIYSMTCGVSCLAKLYDIKQNSSECPYSFELGYNAEGGFNVITDDLPPSVSTSYTSNYIRFNLLSLFNCYSEVFQGSRVYTLTFNYKPFSYTLSGESSPRTIYPFYSQSSNAFFTVTQLAVPDNFVFNAGVLTWDPVEGATQYGVFWTEGDEDKQAFVDSPSYAFNVQSLGEGTHTVRVRALGNMAQTAVDNGETASITAYNASNVIMQVVSLTYKVDGDTVTKFVPVGSKMSENTYEVKVRGKEFGGWFYDSGFSRAVNDTDTISKDMTIYARLSDKKVVERKATWWDEYKWYVIGGIIGLVVVGVVIAVIVGIRKKRGR